MAKILGSSKVSVRYQITIPESVRKTLKVDSGDTIGFVEENGRVYLTAEF